MDKISAFLEAYKHYIKNDDTESKIDFLKGLYELELIVPMQDGNDEHKGQVSFALIVSEDERKFIPAFFNSNSNLGGFSKESLRRIPYKELKHYVVDFKEKVHGIAIEPFGEPILVDFNIIEAADKCVTGMSVNPTAGGKVRLSLPKHLPNGLKEALVGHFEKNINIEKAWLLYLEHIGLQKPHLTLILQFHGTKMEVFPNIAEIIKNYMKAGESFELVKKDNAMDEESIAPALIFERGKNVLLS